MLNLGNNLFELLRELPSYFVLAIFSILGGIVSFINDEKYTVIEFIKRIFAAGFTGVLVQLYMAHIHAGIEITGICTGIAGYSAIDVLRLISKNLIPYLQQKFKFNIKNDNNTNNSRTDKQQLNAGE